MRARCAHVFGALCFIQRHPLLTKESGAGTTGIVRNGLAMSPTPSGKGSAGGWLMCVSASVRQHFRDRCVSEGRSLRLQKSPPPNNRENAGNSCDISKGFSCVGMCEFDPSVVSQAFPKRQIGPLKSEKSPLLAGFCNTAPVSKLPN